jgi:FkbM family methyltransferase
MIEDLIFDVGANNGDDTAHYLSRGYRVVAIEANPVLADRLKDRFRDEVGNRLTVLNVGVWDEPGVLDFFVNEADDEHSSFVQEMGTRDGSPFHVEQVVCTTFNKILADYGVPYYLKVDIEKADIHCLTALQASDLPVYLSVEAHRLDYLAILLTLGYSRFKVVDQTGHNRQRPFDNESMTGRLRGLAEWYRRRLHNRIGQLHSYAPGSSGPFGEETAGVWADFESVAYDWLHFYHGRRKRGTLNMHGWFDFHASRIDN